MPEPEPERPGAVESTAMAVAGLAFATSLVFARGAGGVDPGLFDAGAAVLAGIGLASWAHRLRDAATGTLVRGAGLAAGVALLSTALVEPFGAAAWPALLVVAGGALLQANARRAKARLADDALGLALVGGGLVVALLLADRFPEPARLRVALALVAGGTLAGLGARRVLVDRGRAGLAPTPLGVLAVSALAGAYLGYRGLVREHVANLPLYEWTVAAIGASLVLARLRRRVKDREAPEAWTGVARRHAQDVGPVYDERMGPIAAAVARYLDRGEGYPAYRETMLRAAGARPPEGLVAALDAAPRAPQGRTRGARREAAKARLAAHEAALATLTNERGPVHERPDARSA